MSKTCCLFSALLLLALSGRAQFQTCGTELTPEYIEFVKSRMMKSKLKAYGPATQYPEKINRTIQITAYNLARDSANIRDQVVEAMKLVNKYFTPIGLSFNICEFIQVKDPNYHIASKSNVADANILFNRQGAINMYFVDSIPSESPGSKTCGFAMSRMMIINGVLRPDTTFNKIYIWCIEPITIVHELGHYLGLMHTHETKLGRELADSSNCATAGDLICDTPADPDLLGKVTKCNYDAAETDNLGHTYTPSVTNIMSYTHDKCACDFTPMQYRSMVKYFFDYLQFLK